MSVSDALREAADLIEANPDLPLPYVTSLSSRASLAWYLTIANKEHAAQKSEAANILKTLGGKWDKQPGERFNFEQKRGLLSLTVQVEREAVCERIVTGTETVTIAAKAAEPEQTVTRDVVEWRCEPVLAEPERTDLTPPEQAAVDAVEVARRARLEAGLHVGRWL